MLKGTLASPATEAQPLDVIQTLHLCSMSDVDHVCSLGQSFSPWRDPLRVSKQLLVSGVCGDQGPGSHLDSLEDQTVTWGFPGQKVWKAE